MDVLTEIVFPWQLGTNPMGLQNHTGNVRDVVGVLFILESIIIYQLICCNKMIKCECLSEVSASYRVIYEVYLYVSKVKNATYYSPDRYSQ